jgi:hypothetical protein
MHNEVAAIIANLPQFTAKVKIVGSDDTPHEYTIKTLSPEKGLRGAALQERIARIRAYNLHDGYLRLRIDVEKEIAARQEALTNTTTSPDPQDQEQPQKRQRYKATKSE